MPTYNDTGHGATIVFTTSAFVARIKKIGGLDQDGEKIDFTGLDTSAVKSYKPGDVREPGEVEIEFYFDVASDSQPVPLTVETVTITAPLNAGQSVAGKVAGTAFIKKFTKFPEMETNKAQMGKATIAFDGGTGPAFTKATLSA